MDIIKNSGDERKKYLEYLQTLLRKLCNEVQEKLGNQEEVDAQSLSLWLFKYRKEVDSLEHWEILPEKKPKIMEALKKTKIKGGAGTIGYILKSKNTHSVNNTLEDPRGTVSLEDFQIKNYSWIGVPILDSSEDVGLVVSFFLPKFDAWGENKETKEGIVENCVKRYQIELLSHWKWDTVNDQLEYLIKRPIFKGNTEEDAYTFTLKEIQKFLYLLTPVSYIFALKTKVQGKGDEYHIPSKEFIRLDFKNAKIRLLRELQWSCYLKEHYESNFLKQMVAEVQQRKDCIVAEPDLDGYSEKCVAVPHLYQLLMPYTDFLYKILSNQKCTWFLHFTILANNKKSVEREIGNFQNILKPFKDYLNSFLTKYRDLKENNLLEKKKLIELSGLVFEMLAHSFTLSGEELSRKIGDASESNKFLGLIEETAGFQTGDNGIDTARNKFITLLCQIRQNISDEMRNRIALISFWQFEKDRHLLGINEDVLKKDPDLLERFKQASNMRTIYRAIQTGDKEVIEKYPPLIYTKGYKYKELTSYKLSFETTNNEKEIQISFEKGSKLTPISLEMNDNPITMRYWEKIGSQITRLDSAKLRKIKENKIFASFEDSLNDLQQNKNSIELEKEKGKPSTKIFLVSDRKLSKSLIPLIHEYSKKIYNITKFELEHQNTLRHALRSAVAAIMARNMSHNIGSHVLARLLKEEEFAKYGAVRDQAVIAFNSYLKTRMDFLADISTEPSPATMSLNLYQDALSYLKYQETDLEKLEKRPSDNKKKEEELALRTQRILLDRISAVKSIKYDNIKLIPRYDGEEISFVNNKDIKFASPNGLMGVHACFVIVENIIRNTAKHGALKSDELRVTLDVKKDWTEDNSLKNEFWPVIIWDNAKNCVSRKKDISDRSKKYAVIEDIQHAIDESVIDQTGKRREGNWGIREMKICSAYLRQLPMENIDTAVLPSLLSAVKVDDDGNEIMNDEVGNLGYKLYLLRPKNALIIGKVDLDNAKRKELSNSRIDIKDSLKDEEIKKGITHDFLIYEDTNGNSELIKKYQYDLPLRKMILTDEVKNKLKNSNSPEEFIKFLWSKRLESIKSENVKLLCILGDWKAKNVSEHGSEIPEDGHKYVLSDYRYTHAQNSCIKKKLMEDYAKKREKGILIFWEPIRAWSPVVNLLRHPPQNEIEQEILASRLIEAGVIPVAILDDRIQNSLENSKYEDIPAKEVLEWMNVKQPSKDEINLEAKEIKKTEVEKWIKENCKSVFFLVIHQGILDRIGLEKIKESEKWIEQTKQTHNICEVVITSGRGRPPNVPLNTRFVNLSELQRWVAEETKSKYHLILSLSSARRVKYE